jgi:hypothetical protein
MTDYISREAAIEYVESLVSTMSVCVSKDECFGMKSMQQRAIGAIHDVPAADVAPVVHAEWVVSRTDRGWNGSEYPTHCKCTHCGREIPYQDRDNYCPHCGAKMQEAKQDAVD